MTKLYIMDEDQLKEFVGFYLPVLYYFETGKYPTNEYNTWQLNYIAEGAEIIKSEAQKFIKEFGVEKVYEDDAVIAAKAALLLQFFDEYFYACTEEALAEQKLRPTKRGVS